MLKLYYVPMTRATRPRWLLEELGVPYELVTLDPGKGETRAPAHLARHPLGHVPVLEEDGAHLFESAAICLQLADRFPEKGLAPAPGSPERGAYYQWAFFAMTTLEPPMVDFYLHTLRLPEAERIPAVAEKARARMQEVAAVLEAALEGREWLLGDRFSAADVIVASCLGWGAAMQLVPPLPRITEYRKRAMARPAAKRSRE